MGREPASARTPRSARASAPGPAGLPHGPRAELPSQRLARERLELRAPRLALILGPEGAGKSELLRSLGAPVPPPFERVPGDRLLVDLTRPLTGDEEARILDWLADHPRRRVVLAARGAVPKPVLVLRGEQGEEPVYDTPSLHEAVARALSPAVLSKVDAVLPLPPPDRAALRHLALSLLAAREVALPEDALEQLVQLAEQSGRGVHELAALLARIPRGTYGAP